METVGFKGTDPLRSEIVMNNNIIVQLNTFTYLCCFVSYQIDNSITIRISKFLQIMGISNINFKSSQVQEHTRLNTYITFWHYLLYCMDAKLG